VSREDQDIVRHEDQLAVGVASGEAGAARIRKRIETQVAHADVPRVVEDVAFERAAAAEEDSGEVEILPDGSVSIPIFEEELVVEKRLVLRERVIVRKEIATETEHVETELRRERVELESPGNAA
jgi:uncharacterized protein (TIGR02271 family)